MSMDKQIASAGSFTRAAIGFSVGPTIGDCARPVKIDPLRLAGRTLGADAQLVIGIDLRKDRPLLDTAYDAAAGMTARSARHAAIRINRAVRHDDKCLIGTYSQPGAGP